MKRPIAIQIFSSALILLFTYAALSKLTDHAVFAAQLTGFPVMKLLPEFFAWSIPATELAAVMLLFIPASRLAGLYVASVMLLVFTAFLMHMLLFAPYLPCSCGGIISRLNWKQHVVFNLFFLAVAIAGIFCMENRKNSFRHEPD